MKNLYLLIIFLTLLSCGYPDIDSVPDFKSDLLTDEEINEFCKNTNLDEKNIDNCINDYKSEN